MSDIDDLLAKQLAGESSPAEEAAVQAWLAESPEHAQYYADLQRLWQNAPRAAAPLRRPVDTEAALLRVKGQTLRPARAQRVSMYAWVRWAAAAAVLLAAALVWRWVRPKADDALQIAATAAPRTDTLADGSVVALQVGGSVTTSGGYNQRERRLRLSGNATFQVKPDVSRPFLVETQGLEVRVVGTVFSVQEGLGQVEVYVSEGKVRLSAQGRELYLQRGERATYHLSDGSLSRIEGGDSGRSNREFRFVGTPLGEVVRQLSAAYGKRISLKNPALADCPLRADYLDLPLETVLERLAGAFSLHVERVNDGSILLDGDSCE
ncbi:MAG TPA: FecR domain-containing protein [Saprospiraceae bacterium]|nr:FecR domain-containing protein [Saprospiraceae bacterium]